MLRASLPQEKDQGMALGISGCSQQHLFRSKDPGETEPSLKLDRTYFGSEYHAQSQIRTNLHWSEWEKFYWSKNAGIHSLANNSLQLDRKPRFWTVLLLSTFFSSESMRSSPFPPKWMKRVQAPYFISFWLHWCLLFSLFPTLWHFLSTPYLIFPSPLLCSFSILFVSFKIYIFSPLYPIHSFQDFLLFEVLIFLLPKS